MTAADVDEEELQEERDKEEEGDKGNGVEEVVEEATEARPNIKTHTTARRRSSLRLKKQRRVKGGR